MNDLLSPKISLNQLFCNPFSKTVNFTKFLPKVRARVKSRNFHAVQHTVEITEIDFHREKIPSNQLFSKFFSKHVSFTKFLPKNSESKFPKFPHCVVKTIEQNLLFAFKNYKKCRENEISNN